MSCRQHITMSTFQDITSIPQRFPTKTSLTPPPRADRKMAASTATTAMPTASPTTSHASTSPSGPSYLHGYLSDEEAASPVEDNDQTNDDDDAASLFSIGTLEDVTIVEPATTMTALPARRCCQQAQAMKLYNTAGQVRMVSVPRPDDVPSSPRTLRRVSLSRTAAPIHIPTPYNGNATLSRASNDSSTRSSEDSGHRPTSSNDSEAHSTVSTAPSSPQHPYNLSRAAAAARDEAHKSNLSDASTAVSTSNPESQSHENPRPTPRHVPLFEAALLANEPISTAYALRTAQNPWSANWFATDPHFRQRTAVVTKPFDPELSSDDNDRYTTTQPRRKHSLITSAFGFARLSRGLGRRNSLTVAAAAAPHQHSHSQSTASASSSSSATTRSISPTSPFLPAHRRNLSGDSTGPVRSASVRLPKMVARGADERAPPLVLPPCPPGMDADAPSQLRRASTLRGPPRREGHRHTTYEFLDLDEAELDEMLDAATNEKVLEVAPAPAQKTMPLRRQKSSHFFWPVRGDSMVPAASREEQQQRPRSQSVQLLSGTRL